MKPKKNKPKHQGANLVYFNPHGVAISGTTRWLLTRAKSNGSDTLQSPKIGYLLWRNGKLNGNSWTSRVGTTWNQIRGWFVSAQCLFDVRKQPQMKSWSQTNLAGKPSGATNTSVQYIMVGVNPIRDLCPKDSIVWCSMTKNQSRFLKLRVPKLENHLRYKKFWTPKA